MKKSLASALLAVSMLANTPAYAAEQTIHVELNKTETKGDACRVYMIVGNESGRRSASWWVTPALMLSISQLCGWQSIFLFQASCQMGLTGKTNLKRDFRNGHLRLP